MKRFFFIHFCNVTLSLSKGDKISLAYINICTFQT